MDGIDFKNVITAAELVRMQWRPHGWVLWQMIPQGGITLLAGETASGKSFLGLDLALGVASGRGKAWDMDLGEEIADSSWLVGDRERFETTDLKNEEDNVPNNNTLPRVPSVSLRSQVADPPSREGYVGRLTQKPPFAENFSKSGGSFTLLFVSNKCNPYFIAK